MALGATVGVSVVVDDGASVAVLVGEAVRDGVGDGVRVSLGRGMAVEGLLLWQAGKPGRPHVGPGVSGQAPVAGSQAWACAG